GPKGILFTHISGNPSFVCENLSNLMYLGENERIDLPGNWPIEHSLIPITPRTVAKFPNHGTKDAALIIISGMLEGHGPAIDRIRKSNVSGVFRGYETLEHTGREKTLSMYNEARMFKPERLKEYSFYRASLNYVHTGSSNVYASLYVKPGKLLVYAGNLADTVTEGSLKLDLAARGIKAKSVSWSVLSMTNDLPEGNISGKCGADELARIGIPYILKPWTTLLVKLKLA
ncbi:MAG: hypothetical protein WCI43_07925, partial [Candidatus Firestonebacteria bacterium]